MAWNLVPGRVNADSVTDQEMMGLNAIDVVHCGIVHPQLHQHHRANEDHCSSGRRGRALVARESLVLLVEVEPDLPLDQCIDEQPHHGEHG